ncbi:MAG: phosphoglucomutase/phosphomannomutase family protein [Thermotogota bacterium]
MNKPITFGTSGWRGIIADDFTFENVEIVSQAIAEYLKTKKKKGSKVIIGYDARFMVEDFSRRVAQVLTGNGISVLLCDRPTPTPVISYLITLKKLDGGINLTASHNPYNYCGLKFNPQDGGPAMPDITDFIEKKTLEIAQNRDTIEMMEVENAQKKKLLTLITPVEEYIEMMIKKLDVKKMSEFGLKAGVDMVFGTGNDFLDTIMNRIYDKKSQIVYYDDFRDPYFGGYRPEPDEIRLKTLGKDVIRNQMNMGLALDNDADRFGIVDDKGEFIPPNDYLAMVAYHLYKNKKMEGDLIRSVATSHMMDKIAEHFHHKTKVTPVGFKYIGELLSTGKYALGGEESGGLSIKDHVLEKDGLLACLLAAEMRAYEGKELSGIRKDVEKITGKFHSTRLNIELETNKQKEQIINSFKSKKDECYGFKIKESLDMDGIGFQLEDEKYDTWILARASGTEPVVRIYIESNKKESFDKLLKEVKHLK